MKTYTVQYRQSLLDIALQECGDVLAIIDIALLNNISITEDLEAGKVLLLPEATKPKVVKYYRDRKITLATDIPGPNKPQTIFFPPIPQPWEIGNVYNLEAIATSGLPVSYTSSNTNVATIVNNTLTIMGVGSVTITALQNGNKVYYPAVPVSQNLEIDGIYYGFPVSFRDAIAFRFNAKDTPNFVLRENAGDFFVVSYTDPVSGLTVSQSTASRQPKKIANTVYFDGVDDAISRGGTPTIKEVWVVCQTDKSLFGNYDSPFSGYNEMGFSSLPVLGIFGNPSTTNIFVNSGYALNQRINNISSNSFLPMANLKTWSGEQPTNNNNNISIGAQRLNFGLNFRYFWEGNISDVILFNRVLTNTERADLQAYLQSYHGFTP